jgi:MFS family permease
MMRFASVSRHLSTTREAFARHRGNKRSLEQVASRQSRVALDWTNFFLSDVQEGFGAFIAFYLADLGWAQGAVGVALTIGRVASAVSMLPGGALADAVPWKRGLVAAGIAMIAVAALILALQPSFPLVLLAEILHGGTAGIIGPAIGAISLGIVGRRAMSSRIGRNHRFDAAGNALTAGIMGALGSYVGKSAIFLASAAMTIPALIAIGFVRKDEIDYHRAHRSAKVQKLRSTPSLG